MSPANSVTVCFYSFEVLVFYNSSTVQDTFVYLMV